MTHSASPRRGPLLLLVVLTALLTGLVVAGLPGSASATTVNDVVRALRSDPVYVDAAARSAGVDAGQVRDAVRSSGRHVYVAVLPQAAADGSGGATSLTGSIGRGLGDAQAILFTLTGDTLTGQSGGGSGLASGQAQAIADGSRSGDATSRLVSAVRTAGSSATGGTGSSGGTGGTAAPAQSGGGGGGKVLLVLLLIALAAVAYVVHRRRNRAAATGKQLEGSRADVESLYNRLGADVSNLQPGDDPVARQALADAAERYNATGALLSKADTPGEFEAARRTVVEGLTAARLVRTKLGLDPGPEVPPPPATAGPQLQAAQRVRVGDQEYDGSPAYAPGRQHYWGGGVVSGGYVPGGWYGVPFWESMLIGSALSGGFGGGGLLGGGYGGYGGGGYGGGGYGGGGYGRGYEEGVEDARDARGGGGGGFFGGGGGFSGGDWGGGGGGDWGGGGGGGGDGGGSW